MNRKLPLTRRRLIAGAAAVGVSNLVSRIAMTSPNETNLIVPAEEDRHERTFMQWPVNRKVHPEKAFLRLLQQTIADIANTVSEFELVTLLAAKEHHKQLRRMISGAVELWDIPTDDLWCRDSGPLFARQSDGSLAISHLQFNGWGEKQTHRHDGLIAARIAKQLGLPLIYSGLHGEAGGVEHDGHGQLMAHESSWINENRNPGMSRDEIEKRLLASYGAER